MLIADYETVRRQTQRKHVYFQQGKQYSQKPLFQDLLQQLRTIIQCVRVLIFLPEAPFLPAPGNEESKRSERQK